jgi:DNA invertase Pin-like site-specific DNA recombinase
MRKNKMSSFAYIRTASTDQSAERIQKQQKLIQTYAAENGIVITKTYIDDGFSGLSMDRPEFQRLIQDVKENKDESIEIIVADFSRISRVSSELLMYQEMLKKYNTIIVSTTK